jgi:hypothetical protein
MRTSYRSVLLLHLSFRFLDPQHGCHEAFVRRELKEFRATKSVACNHRITALAWHPTVPHVALVAEKHGDLKLWDTATGAEIAHAIGVSTVS